MDQPRWIRSYRIAFAVLTFTALVAKYVHDTDDLARFLSKFTIQSNAIAMVVLLGTATLGTQTVSSIGWARVRGAAVMYLLTTGIVYGLLLDGFDNPWTSDRHWTHSVLHQLMPIVVVLDLVVRPLLHRLTFGDALRWTVYPVLYLVYSLVRGAIVDWYPYDFIDPMEVGGYDGVALYSAGISGGFLAVAVVIVWVNRRLHRMPPPHLTGRPLGGPMQM